MHADTCIDDREHTHLYRTAPANATIHDAIRPLRPNPAENNWWKVEVAVLPVGVATGGVTGLETILPFVPFFLYTIYIFLDLSLVLLTKLCYRGGRREGSAHLLIRTGIATMLRLGT